MCKSRKQTQMKEKISRMEAGYDILTIAAAFTPASKIPVWDDGTYTTNVKQMKQHGVMYTHDQEEKMCERILRSQVVETEKAGPWTRGWPSAPRSCARRKI